MMASQKRMETKGKGRDWGANEAEERRGNLGRGQSPSLNLRQPFCQPQIRSAQDP